MWRMYKAMKRRGTWYWSYGHSPYMRIARAFKRPIREVKEVIESQKELHRKPDSR